jgi:microcystin-dependent protein
MPSHTHPPASGTGFFTLGGAVNRAGGTDVGEINSGNTGPAGSGAAHNNMQPWLALNYIVKT